MQSSLNDAAYSFSCKTQLSIDCNWHADDNLVHCNVNVDVNECSEDRHDCHHNATCTDTEGSFNCTCNTGYSGDGNSCQGQFTYSLYSIQILMQF